MNNIKIFLRYFLKLFLTILTIIIFNNNIGHTYDIVTQMPFQFNGNNYNRITQSFTKSTINRNLFGAQGSAVCARFVRRDASGNEEAGFSVRITTDPWWHRIIYSDYSRWVKSYGDHSGDQSFNGPRGICRASYMEDLIIQVTLPIYVADTGNNRIVELRLVHLDLGIIHTANTYMEFSREFTNFQFPYDVDYDDSSTPFSSSDDYLWIAETGSHRIVKLDLNSGTIASTYGSYGSNQGEFRYPQYIQVARSYDGQSVSNDDYIYVVDSGNKRIVRLKEETSGNITWKEEFNYHDSTWAIRDIGLEAFGNVWLADEFSSQIILLNKRLKYVSRYGAEGLGQTTGLLYEPVGVDLLFRTNHQGSNQWNQAANALFVTETWSDGSGQIRYRLNTKVISCKYYNVYQRGNTTYIYSQTPESTIPSEEYPHYLCTTFYLTVSAPSRMTAEIYIKNTGETLKTFPQRLIQSGLNYIQWDGYRDNGSFYFHPFIDLAIRFRLTSLYDPNIVTYKTKYFNQCGGDTDGELVTDIRGENITKNFQVYPNYPNPFNSSTHIRYQVPQAGKVKIEIYNILGQKVKTLVNSKKQAGEYTTIWNGRNDIGNEVGSGLYFYKFIYTNSSKKEQVIKKLLLIK